MSKETYLDWVMNRLPKQISEKFSMTFKVNPSYGDGFEIWFEPKNRGAPTLIYSCTKEQVWDDIEPILDLYLPKEGRRIRVSNSRYSLEEMLINFPNFDLLEVVCEKQSTFSKLVNLFSLRVARMPRAKHEFLFENDKRLQSGKSLIVRHFRHW